MKKRRNILFIILILIGILFANKNTITETSFITKKLFHTGNENNLKTSDLIRIYNSKTGFDFTVKSNTTIEEIKKVYGEAKLVTDSAFGGHAYTFYTDNNYSNFLYVETVYNDEYIFSYGTIWKEYQVYNSGYGEDYPFYDTSKLQGLIFIYDSKVAGGIYYNRNKYIGGGVTSSVQYFTDNYNSNPTKYLKEISKQGVLMYKAVSKIYGYETNFEFNEDFFYINEQMKDNNRSIRQFVLDSLRNESAGFIGTRLSYELSSKDYYLFSPGIFANFFFQDGTNRIDRNDKKTVAVFDYDQKNKAVTAIVVEPNILDKTKEIELTSTEKTKLNNSEKLYKEYKSIVDNQEEGESAYDVEPVISPASSLKAGKVKDSYLQAQLKYLNAIKAGAGLPSLSFDDELVTIAQYDAVLLSYRKKELNLQISHSPERPSGVSDEFYTKARGTGLVSFAENAGWNSNSEVSSNMMRIYTNNYIDDSSDLTGTFGHRIAMLNPYFKTLGLGYAPNISVMRFRGSNDISKYTAIAWPSEGVTPYEAFANKSFYWSIHFKNNYKLTDKTNVKVECLNTGDTWNFSSSEAELNTKINHKNRQYILNINTMEEFENRALFYDATLIPRPDYVYKITVSNIQDNNGNTTSYTYRSVIKMFNQDNIPTVSKTIKIDRSNLKKAEEANTYYVPIEEETKLNALLDEGTKNTKITWSIDNSNITITQNGIVYPKTMISNTAKVTVKYDETGITDTIYLKTYNPNQITMSEQELSINANETKELSMSNNSSIGNIEKIEWIVTSYDNVTKSYSYDDEYIKKYLEITKVNDKKISIKAISYPSTNRFKITAKVTTDKGEYIGSSNITVKIPVEVFRISNINENRNNLGSIYMRSTEYGYLLTTAINRDVLFEDNNTYIAKYEVRPEPKNATEIPEFKWEIIENDGCITETSEKGAYQLNKIGKATIKITNLSNPDSYDIFKIKVTDNNHNLTGIQLIDKDLIYTTNSYINLKNYVESDDGTTLDFKNAEISVDGVDGTYSISNSNYLNLNGNYLGNTYKVTIKYNDTSVTLRIRPINDKKVSDYTLTTRRTNTTVKKDEELKISVYLNPNDYYSKNKLLVNELSLDVTYDKNYLEVLSATSEIPNLMVNVLSNKISIQYKAVDGPVILDSKDFVEIKFKSTKNEDKTTYVELKNFKIKTGDPSNTLESVETNEKVTVNHVKYIPITSIKLDKESYTLPKNESIDLKATILPNDTTESTKITWTTSSKYIATVTDGKVTGVSQGTATITAKASNGMTATCTITVTNPITSISLNQSSISIKVGDSKTLTAYITPTSTTDDKTITWTSSDTKIATVSNGKVTGVSAGEATITAKSVNGKTTTCKVTVTTSEVAVTGISLNKTTLSLAEGNSETLTATVTPTNATNKTVTWTSSDTKIATVANGKVTGVKAGTATITAKSNNGKTATCKVTVTTSEVAVTGISLNKTTLSLVEGNSETLTATVTPTNATNKTVTWTSSDTKIATVANGKVTGVKAGTVTITAKSNNGKTATCKVTVTSKEVVVTSIALNKKSVEIEEGNQITLTATINPSNATNKTVTWTSSDTKIATVANGKVNGLKPGTVTITAESNNGKVATCEVTVLAKTQRISYKTHVQTYGWQDYVSNGKMSGTEGEAKRLEGIQIKLENQQFTGNVLYRTHIQTYGWEKNFKKNDEMSGTSGEAKRLEAIEIKLDGEMAEHFDIYYRVHAQTFGWLGWARNGEQSGTAGYAKRLEGIEIKLVEKGQVVEEYGKKEAFNDRYAPSSITLNTTKVSLEKGEETTLVATINPMDATNKSITWTSSDETIATVANGKVTTLKEGVVTVTATTFNKKTASCEINVTPAIVGVEYKTHVQSYGWQNYVKNGEMSGTSGEAKRLEGINIKLRNAPYEGNILYRTHIQTYGWEKEFKKNDEMSGTSGEAKRLEAIEIKLDGEMEKHYDIYYRVHAQSFGWLNWAKNGEKSGTAGYAKRLEGIEIVLVEKGQLPPVRNNQNNEKSFIEN